MNVQSLIEILVVKAVENSNVTLADKRQLIVIGDELIKGIKIEDETIQPPADDVQPEEESD